MFTHRTRTFMFVCTVVLLMGLLPPLIPSTAAAPAAATITSTSKGVTWPLGRWWNTTLNDYNWTGITSDLDDMRKGNITWIKLPIYRSTSYSVYDRLLPLLQARGIDVEAHVLSPRPYYLAADAAYKTDYQTWLATLVSKYKGSIKYWEIHNEPNLRYFWSIDENTTDTVAYANSVKDYVALLQASYQTIKANDSSAQVLLGGLASWKMERFVDELIKQNAAAYFDIVGYHPYPDWSKPTPDGVVDALNRLKAKLAGQAALAAKPIWITEIGFNTIAQWPVAVGHEQTKANYLVDMMQKLRQNGIALPIQWYNFDDEPKDQKTWGRDLVRKNPSTLQTTYLPAYYAYRDLWTAATPPTNTVPPGATTSTFGSLADTYVDSSVTGTNFGAASTLRVNGSPAASTYLKFDLTPLVGKTLDVITLRFKVAGSTGSGSKSQQFVRTCDVGWTEGAMTYTTRAQTSLYTIGGGLQYTSPNTWYNIDLYVPDLQAKAGQWLCLSLVGINNDVLEINSKETVDNPQLVVTHHSNTTAVVTDTFSRSVSDGWGSAESGGAYVLADTAADYDVNGAAGTLNMSKPNTTRSVSLSSVSALNVETTFQVQTNKLAVGGSDIVYFVARRVGVDTEYRARVRFATDGKLWLLGEQVNAGATTLLGSERAVPGVTHTANSSVLVRAQVVGINPTTIRMKAWANGQAEPADWQYSITDTTASLQVPGSVGLRAYLSSAATNAPVLFTWDDFRVTSVAAP